MTHTALPPTTNSKSAGILKPYNASVMLRKGIYDKVAASVILQRYLDFYNSDEDLLVVQRH